ncbi:MAG: 50S ribosomal protein L29 [Clostridia bacterium]|nr:50S ribosomal protein L29 [Clostridia bacterium]MDD4386414.1 50S ribosomal protein L29 [Clostridia bacterium]
MKSSKLADYVKMSESDLQTEIKELKKELFKARFQHAMNGLDNPKKLTEIRRNIARANTMKHTISINASK